MFCSLLFKKSLFFLKKKKTDWLQPDFFWIVTVQEWPKTTPVNTYCPLRTIDFSNVVDIDNFCVETQNKFCFFDNQRVKLAKNGKVLTTRHSLRTLK